MKEFMTIKENTSAQIVEKKSKFLTNVFYVESVKEAEVALSEIKKQYSDASHNCYAYNILESDNILSKSSDDGEPSRNSRGTIA